MDPDAPGTPAKDIPRGKDGPLHHWRRGLVGAVQDWAVGSKANAVKIVAALVTHLELQDGLREFLYRKELYAAETDRIIVDNYRDAIQAMKSNSTVAQLQQHGILLAGAASSKASIREQNGTENRIAARLEVTRGCRSQKRGGRPYGYNPTW